MRLGSRFKWFKVLGSVQSSGFRVPRFIEP
jgi:hypothetical protein